MHSELRIAAAIQMDLVPRTFPPFPERHDLDLYATLVPAREVGGDFYDFIEMDGDRLCLAVADVSGKGVPAALLMAVGRSFLRSLVREGGGPAEVVCSLNDEIAAENEASMFITMFLALVDLRTGEVRYASAGHNPPFHVTAAGAATQVPRVRGIALGARQAMVYDEGSFTLAPGDVLFLYTDGVSEAMDVEDTMFTEPRIGEELASGEPHRRRLVRGGDRPPARRGAPARGRRGAVRRRHDAGVPLSGAGTQTVRRARRRGVALAPRARLQQDRHRRGCRRGGAGQTGGLSWRSRPSEK